MSFNIETNKKAIYYYTSWSGDLKDYQISDIPDCVLDIVYGYWFIDNLGNISSTDSWADTDKRFISDKFIPTPDSWNNDYSNFYGNFSQIKKLKKQRNINVSLVLGSWILNNFLSIINDNINFIHNIISILKKYDIFSGIIIDFSKLGKNIKPKDYDSFIKLLKSIKKALISNGFNTIHMSLFCSAIPEDCNFDISKLNNCIDRLYVMTLDFNITNNNNNITNHHTNPRKSTLHISNQLRLSAIPFK